ncbi:MAG: EpsG family protein [Lachnospiraceae bacterium]|nr:EpsG family protein [Lachnospiraceae bacterium]
MIFLIIMQVLSVAFFTIADKQAKKEKSYRIWIYFSVLMLLIPAAIRNESVGTDVSVYQKPIFDRALRSPDYSSFLLNIAIYNVEMLYATLIFFVSKISSSIQILFLCQEVFVLVPVYIALWKIRKHINVDIAFLSYVFLYYIESYNTVRQNIAMSFVFLAVCMIVWEKSHRGIVFAILAIGFHRSAIVGIVIILLYWFLKKTNLHNSKILRLIIFIVVVFVSENYLLIFKFVVRVLPFLPERYLGYYYLYIDKNNVSVIRLLLEILILIILFVIERRNNFNSIQICWLSTLNLITIGMTHMASSTIFAARILWYLMLFEVLDLSLCVEIVKKRTINYFLYKEILLTFLILYWIYIYAVLRVSNILPYRIM